MSIYLHFRPLVPPAVCTVVRHMAGSDPSPRLTPPTVWMSHLYGPLTQVHAQGEHRQGG